MSRLHAVRRPWSGALDRRRRRRGQQGVTLLETMLAVFLSGLMILPLAGWASVAMKEQVNVHDRNVNASSLGILRSYFVRDVTTASAASTSGDQLDSCSGGAKGERPLLALERGEQRTVYSTAPDGFGGTDLWRRQCAGGAVLSANLLVADVLDPATEATCDSGAALISAAAAASGAEVGKDTKKKDEEPDPGSGDDAACRRVTLRVTTSSLTQVALTAMIRVGWDGSVVGAEPPVVVLDATPVTGPRRLKVRFTGSGSSDPEGEELSYAWEFGDGTTSTSADPVHEYTKVGTVTARLTVSSASGLSSTATVDITVTDNAPVAVIATPPTGTTTYRGERVNFSSAGSNDDRDKEFGGRIVSHRWEFGDGSTSTEANPAKTYLTTSPPGGFTVRLTVTDDAGGTGVAETKVVVANRLPTATIVATPSSGAAPLSVDLSATVVDETTMSPNPALTYAWTFGDGATSTVADPPARTYSTAGSYTVNLTVTDDLGATATASKVITVNGALLPAPTGLKKTNSGKNQNDRFIEFSWNRVENASLYEISLVCVNCSTTTSVTAGGTTQRINGLPANSQNFDAKIRTRNSAGQWGPWSATIRVKS
jgi:PKD repeat protein